MAIRFGIIGCGMIANFHVRALADLPQAELVGCCSRSPESAGRFAKEHQIRAFDSLDEMLKAPDIDAVSICSPSGAHLQPCLAAAAAGKHVVVEKPLEITVDRCDQMIDACQKTGVLLSTIFQSRFHESSTVLKQAVDRGRFGTLSLANAYVKWFRNQEYYDSGAWRGTWDLDGGGALMNQAIHNVDLFQWIVGPIKQVSAFAATLTHDRIQVEDTIVANLRMGSGALGTIEATTSAFPGSTKRLEIYGAGGSAVLEDAEITTWDFAEVEVMDEKIRDTFSSRNTTSGGASDPSAIDYSGHKAQFQNIVDAIQTGTALVIDGPEARKSVEIIQAIYESAKTNQIVDLG